MSSEIASDVILTVERLQGSLRDLQGESCLQWETLSASTKWIRFPKGWANEWGAARTWMMCLDLKHWKTTSQSNLVGIF